MITKELRAKAAQIKQDLIAITPKDLKDMTSEVREKMDRMTADLRSMSEDIQRFESVETYENELKSTRSIPRGEVEETSNNSAVESRRDATNQALRNAIQGKQFDTRALTVTADGTYLIPQDVAGMKFAEKSAGFIYNIVEKLSTSNGDPIKLPLLNDTTNGLVLNSANITVTDPSVTSVTLGVDDIRINPVQLDRSLLMDSAVDLVAFLTDQFDQRYLRTVSNFITNGDGVSIVGLTSITSNVSTANASILKYSDLTSAFAAIDPAYLDNAVFTFNNNVLGTQVLSMVDSNQRPLFLSGYGDAEKGFSGTILGFPVKINQYLPNWGAGNIVCQFGDFKSGYTLREVQMPGTSLPYTLQWLKEYYAILNQTGVVGFARTGGQVTDAGTHPIYNIVVS